MRIHASTIGLAAYMLDVANAADTPTNTVISFSALQTPPVLSNKQQVGWTKANSSIVIHKAYLLNNGDGNVIAEQTLYTKGMGENGVSLRRGLDSHKQKVERDLANSYNSPGFTWNTTSDVEGFVALDYDAEEYQDKNYTMTPVYLQIDWSLYDTPNGVGSSYSSLFALRDATGTATSDSLTQDLMDSNGNFNSPAYGECTGSVGCAQSTSSGPGLPSSTATAAATTSPAGTGSAAASSASNAGGGSTGLSVGAIAGIAVACGLVGLALIGAALWFMCFRRPRTSHAALGQNRGYASDGVGAIMADKELPHVTDSPHSAYAIDRNQLRDPHEAARSSMVESVGMGAGTGLINGGGHVAHGGDDTYTPYSDHSPPAGVSTRGLGSEGTGPMDSQTSLPTGGARSPTPPISTRYAHLVEEGMTDAEIRRLEEEERALDMAIEDAGRSSRAQ